MNSHTFKIKTRRLKNEQNDINWELNGINWKLKEKCLNPLTSSGPIHRRI